MLWMIKQIRPTQVHLTFTRDILLCSYYYTAVEKWCNGLVQALTNGHKNVTPAKGLRRLLTIIFKVNSVCDIGILSFDVIRYTERPPIHIMAFAFGINSKNTFWSGTMKDIITKSLDLSTELIIVYFIDGWYDSCEPLVQWSRSWRQWSGRQWK